jgi:hypothetical protein
MNEPTRRNRLLLLTLLCALAVGLHGEDPPEPQLRAYASTKPPRFAPWVKPPADGYHYLVQEPLTVAPDAPILIYMHCAGGNRFEGMGTTQPYAQVKAAWYRLRTELLERGWIYACPDEWEFDGLEADLTQRYGTRPIYLMGGSWGGKDVFEEARFKLRKDPKAYAGVALLASMIDCSWTGFRNDTGPGAVTADDFPVPVYLAVDEAEEGKIGGAMLKLYLRLRAAGGTVRMDILTGAGHPPVVRVDWKVVLDHLSGPRTGEHLLTRWAPDAAKKYAPITIDPLPADAAPPSQRMLVEPKLVHAAGGGSFWFAERVDAYPATTPSVVVMSEAHEGHLQGLGFPDPRLKEWNQSTVGSTRLISLRRSCMSTGWPYIVSGQGTAAQLLAGLDTEAGERGFYAIGLLDGGESALALAEAGGKRALGVIAMRPSADLLAKLAACEVPVAITTASDAEPEQLTAARAFVDARANANRSGIWIADQGERAKPPTMRIDLAALIKRLAEPGVQRLRCAEGDDNAVAPLEPAKD